MIQAVLEEQSICPRIYVACLASYNSGTLHGVWIDTTIGEKAVKEEINLMLARSKEMDAEEWEIHDADGFLGIKICYEGIETICKIGEKVKELGEMGTVFAELYANYFDFETCCEYIEERLIGCYDSQQDFVYDYVEDTGFLENVPDNVKSYFDYDAFYRDMVYNSEILEISVKYGKRYFFHCY